LDGYVRDVWDARVSPQRLGIGIEGVDTDRLVLAGASARGMMSLMRAARVVAWLDGRTNLVPGDIYSVVPATLGHRVFFTPVYELRRTEIAAALVAKILEKVPTPR